MTTNEYSSWCAGRGRKRPKGIRGEEKEEVRGVGEALGTPRSSASRAMKKDIYGSTARGVDEADAAQDAAR